MAAGKKQAGGKSAATKKVAPVAVAHLAAAVAAVADGAATPTADATVPGNAELNHQASQADEPRGPAATVVAATKVAAPAAATQDGTAQYRVVSPLDMGPTQRYGIGATVSLTERQAKPLLGHTVVQDQAEEADDAGPAGGELNT